MKNELVAANNLIAMAEIPREEIKRQMDRSFLANLVSQHPTLSRNDFLEFINKCQLTGADPRLNQVYLLVHNAWNAEKRCEEPKGTTVFAYQFFTQMAQRTGELDGFGVDTSQDKYMDLVTGEERKSLTSTAWVIRKGCRYEYKARFWEFAKTKKDGSLMKNWKSSPYLMLEKCAVANVMRWAFPESLTGIYTDDEIKGDHVETIVRDTRPSVDKTQPSALEAAKPITEYAAEQKAPSDEINVDDVEKPQDTETKGKIDFADRDIEDLRGEMLEFVKMGSEDMFAKIGKTKQFMIDRINAEKTLNGMKQKYTILMRYQQ